MVKQLNLPVLIAGALFLSACGTSKNLPKDPDWVGSPQATGISGNYLTATGTGDTPESAKKNVTREFSSFFQVKLTSRTVSKTEFTETTTDEGTTTNRTDTWKEQLFQSTGNRLSGITYSDPYLKDGRYWIKGTMDLVAFTADLTDRILSNEKFIQLEIEKAASDPWMLLITGRKIAKARVENDLFNRYLILLNEDRPSRISEFEKKVDVAITRYGIFPQFLSEKDSSDSGKSIVPSIQSGFEPSARRLFPEWKWSSGADSLFLVFNLSDILEENEGTDILLRANVTVSGFLPDRAESFTSNFSVKSRAISRSEATRQLGSSIARRLAEQFPEPKNPIP